MSLYNFFMKMCFELAKRGEGWASPNPLVGCIVVKDGVIVGRGTHYGPGKKHAERIALEMAGEKAKGATLFVNLEPCCHWGRQPPCAPFIVECGVKKVVAAISDPDVRVNGGGFRYLQSHGVEVLSGVLEKEAQWLNRSFLKYATKGLPWVTLKAALTLDGRIAPPASESTTPHWISSEESRIDAHHLRYLNDAILVGANTIARDDPQLTVRHPSLPSKTLLKIILDGKRTLKENFQVFNFPPVLLIAGVSRKKNGSQDSPFSGAEILYLPDRDGMVKLDEVLKELAKREVGRLLVEGGSSVFTQFLQQGLVDEAVFYLAPQFLGNEAVPLTGVLSSNPGEKVHSPRILSTKSIGPDLRIHISFTQEDV